MRYFKIYRKCCTVAHSRVELSECGFDQSLWDSAYDKAYEQLNAEGELEDELTDDGAFDRNMEALDEEAEQLYDDFLTEAESESGFCAGEFYLYCASDDRSIWDFDRQN